MTIIRGETVQFDEHVPVVVIGGGACGLTAALAASQCGADTLVLERDATPRGSTGMSYGAICAAGTKLQQAAGIDDSPRLLYEDILAATDGQTDADAARHLAEHAAPTIDWLADEHDVVLTVEKSWTGLGHRHPRLHAPPNRSGETLLSSLLSANERADAQLLTEALVTTLYVDDAGRVLGVGVERRDGRTENARL